MQVALGEHRGQHEVRGPSVAFAGLTHPACLLAMLVLGLNDHYLKQSMPGWFTGKLSDFAGVFFFPFVLAAIVGLMLPRIRDASLRNGAIVLTGIWFALAKCTNVGWAATLAVTQSVVGENSSIVQDPSDALALVMLAPTWWLWTELARRPRPHRRALFEAPALVCAVLLSLATSQARAEGVYQLHVEADRIYALGLDEVYQSADGLEWERAEDPPASVPAVDAPTGREHHELDWQGRQFSTKSDGRVYGDAGAIEWEIPPDRQRFVRELADELVLGPWDMVVFDDGLIVALGSEGVARREADGTWTRAGVGPARPTPLVATNVDELSRGANLLAAGALTIFAGVPLGMIVLVLAGGNTRARRYALGGALVIAASAITLFVLGSPLGFLACAGLLGGFGVVAFGWSLLPREARRALTEQLPPVFCTYCVLYLAIEAGYSLAWVPRWYLAPIGAFVVALVWMAIVARRTSRWTAELTLEASGGVRDRRG